MINIEEKKSIKCPTSTSLFVSFDYSQDILNIIKQTENAVWDKKTLTWEIPISYLSFLIDELVYIDDITIKLLENKSENKLDLILDHSITPFEYQKEGIRYLLNNPNCLLLDVPGLGKTLQIIYTAEELKVQKNIEHCLIVCGINTLKQNWKKEIEKCSRYSCRVIGEKINSKGKISYSSTKERAEELYNHLDEFFAVINVESLRSSDVIDAIKNSKNKFEMIVVDECHKCCSPTADQSKGMLKLKDVGNYHYGLTGTLLTNSPLNSYIPLKFIGKMSATWTAFKSFYAVYEKAFGHNQIVGYKNIDILKEMISECSIRRDKSLLNLPPKVIIPEYLEMSDEQSSFYSNLQQGIVEEADRVNIKTSSLLGLVTRLRQAATCPNVLTSKEMKNCKLERARDLIEEIVDNGEKVVVFSTFKEPIYKLQEMIKEYNPLIGTGDLSDEEVSNNIDKFQKDPKYKVFLCTTSKCGTGITLTAASYEIFLDSVWTAALETQCEDRCYRVGTNKTVFIYKLIAEGTIDERIQKILKRKQGISDYIIDNKPESEELKELLGLC